jgi:hypothetical protein
MAAQCSCGNKATHSYAGSAVCATCYQTRATLDERPNNIPANYDWAAEMDTRQLPE